MAQEAGRVAQLQQQVTDLEAERNILVGNIRDMRK
jgi:hypothetical protein